MKKTKQKLGKYWDKIVLKIIPPYANFKKVESEIKEHFSFLNWAFKRIIFPLIIFYVIMGLAFNTNVFGSIFISLLLFIYSNFLPDTDFLIQKTKNKNRESLWYEIYSLLFFAPVIIYYVIAGRARPLYSTKSRPFHNLQTVFIYGAFLFVIGSIFWTGTLQRLLFPLFGMIGFLIHLMVDRGKLKIF